MVIFNDRDFKLKQIVLRIAMFGISRREYILKPATFLKS